MIDKANKLINNPILRVLLSSASFCSSSSSSLVLFVDTSGWKYKWVIHTTQIAFIEDAIAKTYDKSSKE